MEGIEAGVLREKLEIDELIEQTKKVNYKMGHFKWLINQITQ